MRACGGEGTALGSTDREDREERDESEEVAKADHTLACTHTHTHTAMLRVTWRL